jgi:hypothetical protein
MARPRNSIAIKTGVLLALLCAAAAVCAAPPAGTVIELDGRLLAKNTVGAVRVLSLNSPFHQGDLLAAKQNTYAQVNLADQSAVTLKPDTFLTIQQYTFDVANPQHNVAVLELSKGGVRIAAGRLGKPGEGSFKLVTPSGTIEAGNATFIAQYVAPAQTQVVSRGNQRLAARAPLLFALNETTVRSDAVSFAVAEDMTEPLPFAALNEAFLRSDAVSFAAVEEISALLAQNSVPGGSGGLNPGLYVQVLDGSINLTNNGGTQNFTAGQFGFTPGFQQPPVILPNNPGLQFTPPPSFSSTTGSQGSSGGKPGDVDCQVR